MKVNLRKAAQIQTEIRKKIKEYTNHCDKEYLIVTPNTSYDANEFISNHREVYNSRVDAVITLNNILQSIRIATAILNASASIDILLTKINNIDNIVKFLENICSENRTLAMDDSYYLAEVNKILDYEKLNLVDKSSAYRITRVEVPFLTSEMDNYIKEKIYNLKKERNLLSDVLIEKNIKTEIDIPTQEWDYLVNLKIV